MTGLSRQHALNERGEDETIYLARLFDQVRSGYNHASMVVARWKGPWNYDLRRLVAGTSYEAEGMSSGRDCARPVGAELSAVCPFRKICGGA